MPGAKQKPAGAQELVDLSALALARATNMRDMTSKQDASHEGTHLACFRGHDSHQIQPRLKVPIRGTDLGYITLGNLAGGTLASHHRSVTLWAYTVQ